MFHRCFVHPAPTETAAPTSDCSRPFASASGAILVKQFDDTHVQTAFRAGASSDLVGRRRAALAHGGVE
jgi:hypothetical protein